MMDLGKMLMRALIESPSGLNGSTPSIQGINLTAAAEAFLAKVREAEALDLLKSREGKGLEFSGNTSGTIIREPFQLPDHTGPVPFYGDVE